MYGIYGMSVRYVLHAMCVMFVNVCTVCNVRAHGKLRIANTTQVRARHVIAKCAHIERAESPMQRKCACDRRRNMRTHWEGRIADASHVRVRPSSQYVRTLQVLGRRCNAIARASVIAACTHIGSGGSPMHRNCACDRHRAHMASAESPMHRKCACDRHRSMRAHCKRRVADASQLRVRPSSQHARALKAQNRRCIKSARATVIATCAHNASSVPPMHRKCACDRHRSMRAHCKRRAADASQVRVRPPSQHARTMEAVSHRCIASARAAPATLQAVNTQAGNHTRNLRPKQFFKLQCHVNTAQSYNVSVAIIPRRWLQYCKSTSHSASAQKQKYNFLKTNHNLVTFSERRWEARFKLYYLQFRMQLRNCPIFSVLSSKSPQLATPPEQK